MNDFELNEFESEEAMEGLRLDKLKNSIQTAKERAASVINDAGEKRAAKKDAKIRAQKEYAEKEEDILRQKNDARNRELEAKAQTRKEREEATGGTMSDKKADKITKKEARKAYVEMKRGTKKDSRILKKNLRNKNMEKNLDELNANKEKEKTQTAAEVKKKNSSYQAKFASDIKAIENKKAKLQQVMNNVENPSARRVCKSAIKKADAAISEINSIISNANNASSVNELDRLASMEDKYSVNFAAKLEAVANKFNTKISKAIAKAEKKAEKYDTKARKKVSEYMDKADKKRDSARNMNGVSLNLKTANEAFLRDDLSELDEELLNSAGVFESVYDMTPIDFTLALESLITNSMDENIEVDTVIDQLDVLTEALESNGYINGSEDEIEEFKYEMIDTIFDNDFIEAVESVVSSPYLSDVEKEEIFEEACEEIEAEDEDEEGDDNMDIAEESYDGLDDFDRQTLNDMDICICAMESYINFAQLLGCDLTDVDVATESSTEIATEGKRKEMKERKDNNLQQNIDAAKEKKEADIKEVNSLKSPDKDQDNDNKNTTNTNNANTGNSANPIVNNASKGFGAVIKAFFAKIRNWFAVKVFGKPTNSNGVATSGISGSDRAEAEVPTNINTNPENVIAAILDNFNKMKLCTDSNSASVYLNKINEIIRGVNEDYNKLKSTLTSAEKKYSKKRISLTGKSFAKVNQAEAAKFKSLEVQKEALKSIEKAMASLQKFINAANFEKMNKTIDDAESKLQKNSDKATKAMNKANERMEKHNKKANKYVEKRINKEGDTEYEDTL